MFGHCALNVTHIGVIKVTLTSPISSNGFYALRRICIPEQLDEDNAKEKNMCADRSDRAVKGSQTLGIT